MSEGSCWLAFPSSSLPHLRGWPPVPGRLKFVAFVDCYLCLLYTFSNIFSFCSSKFSSLLGHRPGLSNSPWRVGVFLSKVLSFLFFYHQAPGIDTLVFTVHVWWHAWSCRCFLMYTWKIPSSLYASEILVVVWETIKWPRKSSYSPTKN